MCTYIRKAERFFFKKMSSYRSVIFDAQFQIILTFLIASNYSTVCCEHVTLAKLPENCNVSSISSSDLTCTGLTFKETEELTRYLLDDAKSSLKWNVYISDLNFLALPSNALVALTQRSSNLHLTNINVRYISNPLFSDNSASPHRCRVMKLVLKKIPYLFNWNWDFLKSLDGCVSLTEIHVEESRLIHLTKGINYITKLIKKFYITPNVELYYVEKGAIPRPEYLFMDNSGKPRTPRWCQQPQLHSKFELCALYCASWVAI